MNTLVEVGITYGYDERERMVRVLVPEGLGPMGIQLNLMCVQMATEVVNLTTGVVLKNRNYSSSTMKASELRDRYYRAHLVNPTTLLTDMEQAYKKDGI